MRLEMDLARDLVEGLADAAVLLDRSMQPVFFNEAYVVLSGLRRKQIARRLQEDANILAVVGSKEILDGALVRQCFDTGRQLRIDEVEVQNGVGEPCVVNLLLLPIKGGNAEVTGVLLCLRDVSAESRIQERYKQLLALERARADEFERLVAQRTQRLTAALEEVTRLSRTDALTGLLNRRAFFEHARREVELARRHGRILGVLMCDLDHFKRINDTYGHDVGDAVLVATAQRLQQTVRQTDCLARLGGEEFIVMLSETSLDGAVAIGERCNAAVREIALAGLTPSGTGNLSISVGLAFFPEHSTDLDELVAAADKAMYAAKHAGRDCFVIYDPKLRTSVTASGTSSAETPTSPRVLIVDAEAGALSEPIAAGTTRYEVTIATDAAAALALCRRLPFDVIVVANRLQTTQGAGADLLTATVPYLPGAIRLLLLEENEDIGIIGGAAVVQIDHVLRRAQCATHLASAIDQGLLARALVHQRAKIDNRSTVYWPSRTAEMVDEIIHERALRFVRQPIKEAQSLRPVAYEMLCRVAHRNFSEPQLLFDSAGHSGRIWQLGRVARQGALRAAQDLPEDVLIFLNLHPSELEDPQFLAEEPELRAQAPRIVFELTERAAIPDFDRFRGHVNKLRDQGFRLAIDDLGSGYAALSAIGILEPDFIKIDMALVRNLDLHLGQQRLIARIVDYANDASARVVAEGIESQAELETAQALGCHWAQGYLLGRPE